MTIDEADNLAPKGFSGSQISNIRLDYLNQEAVFSLNVDVTPIYPVGDFKTQYARGELKLTGLQYFVITPPDREILKEREAFPPATLWSSSVKFIKNVPELPPLQPGGFQHCFKVSNGCVIYLAAVSAAFEWIDDVSGE